MNEYQGGQPHTRLPRPELEVSVALCTFNGARWIKQFLDSLVHQELLPDELVVQDDCSTDGTEELVAQFAECAPFPVTLQVNPTRLGSTINFATALGRTRGKYIALADQDDIWYPAKLRLLVDELKFDPTITMVFSNADLIGEDGRIRRAQLWNTRLVGHVLRNHSVVPGELLAKRALTTGCTMALRRRAVSAALPFPDALDNQAALMRHDRWLSLVSAAVGTVRALPEPLMGFRVHSEQETGVLIDGQLRRSLLRAAAKAFEGQSTEHVQYHSVRASQLEIAAQRAELLGDFEGAETLRRVVTLHRIRSEIGAAGHLQLRLVWRAIRAGAYSPDLMGLGAVAADVVRSTRTMTQAETTAA